MKKILLYALACTTIVFASCSDNDKDDNGLSGENKLKVKASEITGIPSGTEITKVRLNISTNTTVTLASSGWKDGFEIEFPETIASSYLYSYKDSFDSYRENEGYEYSVTLSNENVKVADDLGLEAYDSDGEYLGSFYLGNSSVWGRYIYADSDCRVKGKVITANWTDEYDLDLKKGWNVIYESETEKDDRDIYTFTTTRPASVGWLFERD